MKSLIILFLLFFSGCSIIKDATPVVNVYGETDYTYIRVGLMWGTSLTNYISKLEEEDFLRGRSGGSSKSSSNSGGCSNGSCSSK